MEKNHLVINNENSLVQQTLSYYVYKINCSSSLFSTSKVCPIAGEQFQPQPQFQAQKQEQKNEEQSFLKGEILPRKTVYKMTAKLTRQENTIEVFDFAVEVAPAFYFFRIIDYIET